ncbi:hypothetical protein C2S51_029388 [Perilla frutescens var. frutescens]|nr:hypothetical protein C2S51_029388 [Perilla frutescens var. frutescens]
MAGSEEGGKCEGRHVEIDRISTLRDELLGCVLCFLSFKEATATSILSRRWRYSWSYTPKLDFNGVKSLYALTIGDECSKSSLQMERLNYMRWVNHVIALCNESSSSSTVEDFKVYFNLDKTHETCINEWLRYALSKKVRTLELKLEDVGGVTSRKYDDCYTFPLERFSNDSICFKNLRRICMQYVNVSGEALEFFLKNCPLLEDLSVSQSGHFLGLKITGPFPLFKRLEIHLCHNIKSVEIRSVDLVYFKYIGSRIDLRLENVPRLVNIHIGGVLTHRMGDVLSMLSSYLPQLEVFTLDKFLPFSWKETEMFYSAVKMRNLKQLMVSIDVRYNDSLMPLTNLLHASPCLQSFLVKANRTSPEFVERKVEKISYSYPHLKEVKFMGYCGVRSDLELILHLVENATALEDIIVDTRYTWNWDSTYCSMWKYDFIFKDHFIEREGKARTRAKEQLPQLVPPRVNLNVLD